MAYYLYIKRLLIFCNHHKYFCKSNYYIKYKLNKPLSKSALFSLLNSSKFEENVANDDWLS